MFTEHTVQLSHLGGDDAEGAQHGPPRVQHLQCAVLLEALGVRRQARRVLHRLQLQEYDGDVSCRDLLLVVLGIGTNVAVI